MSKIRDHFSDARDRAADGRVKVSNVWERAVGNRVRGARQQASNKRNRRTIERGRAPRRERVAAEVKSRTPIYRDRINPAHGNKHREDVRLHKTDNEWLSRWKVARELPGPMDTKTRQRLVRADQIVREEQADEIRRARPARQERPARRGRAAR